MINNAGWIYSYFIYADVSLIGHGCSVSQHPQFYNLNEETFQMLPCPYLVSFRV